MPLPGNGLSWNENHLWEMIYSENRGLSPVPAIADFGVQYISQRFDGWVSKQSIVLKKRPFTHILV